MDDEDDFLYGGTPTTTAGPSAVSTSHMAVETFPSEAMAETETVHVAPVATTPPPPAGLPNGTMDDDNEGEESGSTVEEDSDDDIEIIIDAPPPRSVDFRNLPNRPQTTAPARPAAPPGPALTTEYTPIQRDAAIPARAPLPQRPGPAQPPATTLTPSLSAPTPPSAAMDAAMQHVLQAQPDDGFDASKYPPARAPASHPQINLDAVGTVDDGRSVLDLDLAALADKPWRRPGSDLSDWFNYGFDEISWEAYCYRRKDVGDLASLLKTSVLNYTQMNEEQVQAIPNEIRQMAIAATFAPPNMNMGMMGGPGGHGAQNGMEMSMGGMGMDADDGSGMMHHGMSHGGPQDGFVGQNEFNDPQTMFSQQQQQQQQQPPQLPPPPQQQQQPPPPQPAVPSLPVRAPPNAPTGPSRGIPGAPRGPRGGGSIAGRGRGASVAASSSSLPARTTSPLPPNVPTGPRARYRDKDRDRSDAAEGLDYGADRGERERERDRDSEGRRERDRDRERERDRERSRDRDRERDRDDDDRRSSRKRRGSPPEDSGRSSKRR